MRSAFFLFVVATSLSAAGPATAQRTPLFRDFLSGVVYRGAHSEPDLSSPEAYNFRTRLREAAQLDVNFASHYRVVTWGCGTSCVGGAAVDVLSGLVTFFPFSICCSAKIGEADFQPVLVRPNSRLIVFVGQRGEEPPDAAHFYEFTGGKFVFLASSKPFSQPQPDSVAQEKSAPTQEALTNYRARISPPPQRAPTQSPIAAAPTPPATQQSPPEYCIGFSREACQRIVVVVDSKIKPAYCVSGYGHTDKGLSPEQIRICNAMPSPLSPEERRMFDAADARKKQMIVDARAMVQESLAQLGRFIETIEMGYSCGVVDKVSADVAILNIHAAMSDDIIKAGLLGDKIADAMFQNIIEISVQAGKEAADRGACSTMTPADRARLRSMVSGLRPGG